MLGKLDIYNECTKYLLLNVDLFVTRINNNQIVIQYFSFRQLIRCL